MPTMIEYDPWQQGVGEPRRHVVWDMPQDDDDPEWQQTANAFAKQALRKMGNEKYYELMDRLFPGETIELYTGRQLCRCFLSIEMFAQLPLNHVEAAARTALLDNLPECTCSPTGGNACPSCISRNAVLIGDEIPF